MVHAEMLAALVSFERLQESHLVLRYLVTHLKRDVERALLAPLLHQLPLFSERGLQYSTVELFFSLLHELMESLCLFTRGPDS